jgi:hypothetical protein
MAVPVNTNGKNCHLDNGKSYNYPDPYQSNICSETEIGVLFMERV